MTENSTDDVIIDDEGNPIDEMAMLKAQAKTMGLRISPKIGLNSLRKKIKAALSDESSEVGNDEPDEGFGAATVTKHVDKNPEDYTVAELKKMTTKKREITIRARQKKKEMALIRCRVANLDPSKNDLHGDFHTVITPYLGAVQKYIPYDEASENGYHIPRILLTHLRSRKFLQKRKIKRNGREEIETKYVSEFNIEELPPLTQEELDELRVNQEAAQRVGIK